MSNASFQCGCFEPTTIPINVMHVDQPAFELHTHLFNEIVIIIAGKGLHGVGGELSPIRKGDIFVIKGDQAHEYQDTQDLHLINIMYDPDNVIMKEWDLKSIPGYHSLFTLEPECRTTTRFDSFLNLPPKKLTQLCGFISDMESELKQKSHGYQFMAIGHLMRIIGYLSRSYVDSRTAAPDTVLYMGKVISDIEINYSQQVTLEELAERVFMSKRNFTRVFKKAMGVSPIQYLINCRVTAATDYLSHSDASITEIAYEVGFQDSNYFSRKFTDIMGVSPLKYRKNVETQRRSERMK